MAATPISSLITAARFHLKEPTARFWSDVELLGLATRGMTDLWAAVMDLHQEHFLTINVDDVTLASDATTLTGVPADTFRVHLIEPANTTETGTSRNIVFVPRDYNHKDFVAARAQSSTDPFGDLTIYYALTGAGSPIGAPTVQTAPMISSAIDLRFVYVPALGVSQYTVNTNNPIPGESDNALIAWIVGFARAKEREDRMPDPGWLAVYATEKQSLLTRMTPRQTQEPNVVDGLFEEYWR